MTENVAGELGGSIGSVASTEAPETTAVHALDGAVGELLTKLEREMRTHQPALARAMQSRTYRDVVARAASPAEMADADSLALFSNEMEAVRARYDDRVFKFGIVGFQSSGKSYLISALFNEEGFLPSLDEATTSVVTRIRYPQPDEDDSRITVHFKSLVAKQDFVEFLDHLNDTELAQDPIRYRDVPAQPCITADVDQKLFFLKCENPGRDLPKYRLITEVHILRRTSFLTDYTEIIDLPGLGGPYALLDETTLQYLEEVDAVLFITPISHNWVAKDTEVFRAFASRPNVFNKTFFVLSKLDSPGSPLAKSVRTFHSLLGEFVSPDVRRDRTYYVSPWMHLYDRLSNRAQRAALEGVAQAYATQDPASFFLIDDPELKQALSGTLTPRDGGILRLRDELYRFFSTQKRLLQLNEVLQDTARTLDAHGERFEHTVQVLGGHTSRGKDVHTREVAWLRRKLVELCDETLPDLADMLLEDPPAARYTPECEHALTDAIAALPDGENRRSRAQVVEAHGPDLARDLASRLAKPLAVELAERTRTVFDRHVTGHLGSYPEPLRSALMQPLQHWRLLCQAAVRTVLGTRMLQACLPHESATAEMIPLHEHYLRHVAESAPYAAERASAEVPGALVAAWDTLVAGLLDAFDATVPSYYRQHPNAPRPLVDSPESVLAHIDPFARAISEGLRTTRELDDRVQTVLERL